MKKTTRKLRELGIPVQHAILYERIAQQIREKGQGADSDDLIESAVSHDLALYDWFSAMIQNRKGHSYAWILLPANYKKMR